MSDNPLPGQLAFFDSKALFKPDPERLVQLKAFATNCRKCKRRSDCKQVVFGEGCSTRPKIAFVGENASGVLKLLAVDEAHCVSSWGAHHTPCLPRCVPIVPAPSFHVRRCWLPCRPCCFAQLRGARLPAPTQAMTSATLTCAWRM